MISCRLIFVTRNQKGLPASNEVCITGETIELGRGAACQVHLPDHRVSLLHATIRRHQDGTLQIEAAQDALISINGFMERSAALDPGTLIGVGPYLLTARTSADDTNITLSVDRPLPDAESLGTRHATPVTLSALGISKRKVGFGLATLILLGLLVLPLLSRFSPAFEAWQAALPVALTQSLSPGPLRAGHGVFGMKCSTCHQDAFREVADPACTTCHERMGRHLPGDAPQAKSLGDVRCADCHASHQGKYAATKNGSSQCLKCHGRLDTKIAAASDFGSSHPSFHLAIPVGKEIVRVQQDAKAKPPENSGLKFSHQLHLVKEGVKSPTGNTVLNCRDCHSLDPSGEYFAAVEMEKSCQQSRCHKLRFAEPVQGLVPHGSEREALGRLRNFYLNWLAEAPAENLRKCMPDRSGNTIQRTLDCADRLALEHAAATLFNEAEKKLECALCHELVRTGVRGAPWKVVAVRSRHDWQPKAEFNHAKHGTVGCAECHDKTNSKSSADVSFPGIEKCRACHAGSYGASSRVASNCESCHRFHRVAGTPDPA